MDNNDNYDSIQKKIKKMSLLEVNANKALFDQLTNTTKSRKKYFTNLN